MGEKQRDKFETLEERREALKEMIDTLKEIEKITQP